MPKHTTLTGETDDVPLTRCRLFVDSFATTLDHIGELMIRLASGAITRDAVHGDLHALGQGDAGWQSDEDITVLKNSGGAHLDVMIAHAVAGAVE